MKRSVTIGLFLFFILNASYSQTPGESVEENSASVATEVTLNVKKKKKPLRIKGKKILLMRVLARPFSNIYSDKSPDSNVVESNIPALKPFYVYEKPTPEEKELEDGWYQVGTNNRGKIIGWMQAKDVFEWNQTMCLLYTHPEGRKPVLMFEHQSSLKKLLESSSEDRRKKVDSLYSAIENNDIPKNFPVTSVEPKRAVDWKKEFYFLPILNYKAITLENREARLLKLTATTNVRSDARQSTDIRKNEAFVKNASSGSTIVPIKDLEKLNINIVWVTDTTVSMRPYIERTLQVIENVSKKIADLEETNAAIKFGIWGYRDNLEAIPDIGYNTKNYTPELLPVNEFYQVLKDVKVTQVDSIDYPEDMFSGVNQAINNTQWQDNALRFIILVGDAPSHKVGHDWNLSGQNAETLRSLATERNISIFSLHINNPKAKRFEETARAQYTLLATNDGMNEPAFEEVVSTNQEQFSQVTNSLAMVFTDNLGKLKHVPKKEKIITPEGNNNANPADNKGSSSSPTGEKAFLEDTVDINDVLEGEERGKNIANNNSTKTLANSMFKAALVKWIGSQTNAKPPRDIVAWAVDKDLEDPDIPSVEVRLLINKRQLDSLATVLDSIIKAGIQGQISGEDFFSSLQATTAMISRDPNMISQAKRIADTGLVPEFLAGLPYQSRLMAIDRDLWESWSADEQMDFINDMSAKVEQYSEIHDSPEGWIPLNPDDDPDEYVYPISLDMLP